MTQVSTNIQSQYAALQKQHQDFCNHLNLQLTSLQQQLAILLAQEQQRRFPITCVSACVCLCRERPAVTQQLMVRVNQQFPVFYRLRSAYTRNKISKQSDVPAVILLDWFSTTAKNKLKSNAAQREESALSMCLLDEKGSRIFASRVLVIVSVRDCIRLVTLTSFCEPFHYLVDVTPVWKMSSVITVALNSLGVKRSWQCQWCCQK